MIFGQSTLFPFYSNNNDALFLSFLPFFGETTSVGKVVGFFVPEPILVPSFIFLPKKKKKKKDKKKTQNRNSEQKRSKERRKWGRKRWQRKIILRCFQWHFDWFVQMRINMAKRNKWAKTNKMQIHSFPQIYVFHFFSFLVAVLSFSPYVGQPIGAWIKNELGI